MKKNLFVLTLSLCLLPFTASSADLANGKAINKNCALCHGLYGQGASGKLSPRLAGLPQEYLEKALKDYRSGARQNYMMLKTAALDKSSDKDIEDISAYLASIDLSKFDDFDIEHYGGDVDAGKEMYKDDCKTCHARDGFGKPKKEAPPLAGQHHEYLFQSVKMFQSKVRPHDNDPEDETFDDYSDKDISNIFAYVATLDNKKFEENAKFVPPQIEAKRAMVAAAKPAEPVKPAAPEAPGQVAKAASGKKVESQGGLKITDITQTVAQMALEDGVSVDDAVQAMLSKASDLNLKLVGEQHVSKELESRGVDTPHLSIFQFCDPMDARTMILSNPVFASYMPCRISLVEDENNKMWLMMLNLDMLINNDLLDSKVVDTAIRVNSAMLEVMVAGATGDF